MPLIERTGIENKIEAMLKMMGMRRHLYQLKEEHRDLDVVIHEMSASPYTDQLRLRRMKLRKLRLKDEIKVLEAQLIPDIDA